MNAYEKLIYELFDKKVKKTLTAQDLIRVEEQNNLYVFTHEEDGQIVAMTVLYVIYLFSRNLGVIEEVVTLMEHRNKGIGSTLVKQAIEKAKELELDCIELNVPERKPDVIGFYEHLGFEDRKNRAMRLWIK
jgi:ribosomal protein S18 acetylase RimI-like enzyme